jgi:hypothetical protein
MADQPPLSTWNNNPGNLRYNPKINYEGAIGYDPDTKFVIFETPEFGRKGLIQDINAKLKKGINTPSAFVDAYLGNDPKNTDEGKVNYKGHIAKTVGLGNANEPFPEGSAEKIADAITGFEGGTWNKPAEKKKEESSSTSSGKAFNGSDLNTEEVKDAEKEHPNQNLEYTDPKEIPGVQESTKNALKVVGAKLGTSTAAGVETGKKVLPLVPNIYNSLVGNDINMNRPSTRLSMQKYLNSQINHNLNLNLSDLEKEYNALLKAKDPATNTVKIRTMAEVQQALNAIKPTPDEMIAKPRVEQVRPGVFRETGEFTSKKIPGNPGIDMSKYELNPNTPVRNEVKAGVKTAGNVVKGALPSVARVGIGTLGGLGALSGGYDTYESAREKGWTDPRTISKGAATLGSTLMMYPSLPTEIVGGLLNVPELIWNGYDWVQKGKNNSDSEQTQKALESAPIN